MPVVPGQYDPHLGSFMTTPDAGPPELPPALLAAYEATAYRVQLPGSPAVTVRVGRTAPALDDALSQAGAASWAFVTAHNPGPRRLSRAVNTRRAAALVRAVRRRGLSVWPAAGLGHSGGPTESGVAILGATTHDALALGRAFGQLAVLHGRCGGPVHLLLSTP